MRKHIGTWNFLTPLQAGKLKNSKQEIKNGMDLLVWSETEVMEIEIGDYKLFYSVNEKMGGVV